MYEGVSKSFRTGRLERELQMVEFFATRCSFIAILRVSLVSFAAITLCVASQGVFIIVVVVVVIYFVMTQSGNFWIHPRTIAADQIRGFELLQREPFTRRSLVASEQKPNITFI
jgi:hypothetical protein